MASLLNEILVLNGLGDRACAEPFAGGAGASLQLLYSGRAPEIHINDLDPAIHDFWWTLVHRPKPFLAKLASTRVSIAEWHRQRDIYRRKSGQSRLQRGFSAFYLNRCNRSGIIANGSVIGGLRQTGKWGVKARFNKTALRQRFEKISEFRASIHVTGMDGIDFIRSLKSRDMFFFIDPPYFNKGKTLYLNALQHKDHRKLATLLKTMPQAAWILTYDDCPEIREMYRGWARIRKYRLLYSAADRRNGQELLISPKWMKLPSAQTSDAIDW